MPLKLIALFFAALVTGWGPIDVHGGDQQQLNEIERELAGLPELIPSLQTTRRIGFHGVLRDEPAWVIIDLETHRVPETIVLFPARLPVEPTGKGSAFPTSLTVEISDDVSFDRKVRIGDWSESAPGEAESIPFLTIPGNGAGGRFVRILVPGDGAGREHFRLGEVVVLAGNRNVALRRPVTSSESVEQARRWERQNLTDGYLWCLPLRGREESPTNGCHSAMRKKRTFIEENDAVWFEVDLGEEHAIDEIRLVPANPRGSTDAAGYGFPAHFLVLTDVGTASERVVLDEAEEPFTVGEALPNPGATQVMISTDRLRARRIRLQAVALSGTGSSGRAMNYFLALSEIEVWRGGENLASGKQVLASDTIQNSPWSLEALTDGYCSRFDLLDWSTWLSKIERAENLRKEAVAIQAAMLVNRERTRRRTVGIALAAVVFVTLLCIIAIMSVRAQAARSREKLRQRIARDLHDEIGASLSHLAIQSDLAADQLQSGTLEPARLERISSTALETIDHMRDVIWLLNPKAGNWSEFARRVESISERLLDGIDSEMTSRGRPPTSGQPPISWVREFVAFLKEALTNARKHSAAGRVTVEFDWTSNLQLRIIDDGCGFDPGRAAGGSGLGNLKRRASAMKADFELESKPGEGTTILLTAPLPLTAL